MKVCTEACLFGAWLADQLKHHNLQSALDIGTGTGLLSLMLAQQTSLPIIDAIELDPAAAEQAASNIRASAWKDRIKVFQGDVMQFTAPRAYSLVFSNPPFFEQSELSPDPRVNQAKHEKLLDLATLIRTATEKTTPAGYFAMLLPYSRMDSLLQKISHTGFGLVNRLDVCQTEKHSPFRSFSLFQKEAAGVPLRSSINIRDNGVYSTEFIRLLQPYYLYL
jgi:tRNA1Val (adenine37-N6)-methyltransferase